ncbi:MAG: PIN domain-containing protein [Armatimonadota bacterium]|nr:PIN domain-containing protein [Armatimonadota bacterium]
MRSACLVDTNVLVYAYDPTDDAKRRQAAAVLAGLGDLGVGALSPQILSEFFVVATRRIPRPLPLAEAERSVTHYIRSWKICEMTGWTVLEAVVGVQRHQLGYWDSLVWATARLNEIPLVLSEDFEDGRIIEGVRFVNPFSPGFDLDTLVGA